MNAYTLRGCSLIVACALFMIAAAIADPPVAAQETSSSATATDLARATQLFSDGKYAEALPLLERLARAKPDDPQVLELYGMTVFVNSNLMADAASRKEARLRARTTLLRAKALGANSGLLQVVLAEIPEDGGERRYSANPEADESLRAGERAFTKGDMEAALAFYERAMTLDSKLYQAPLFAGDTFFQRKQYDKASDYYARAVHINENIETAYRYWGNALLLSGKTNEAQAKYIEAIIAEPYNPYVWNNGLERWAARAGVQLTHARIEQPPRSMASRGVGSETTITIDPKALADTTSAAYFWSFYDLTRATYAKAVFAKEYPNEKTYRHSLKEEASALRTVADIAARSLKEGKIKILDPSLVTLIKLRDEDLLEAYVLLARPDKGIAQDYEQYRMTNRDKLRRYLTNYVAAESR